MGNPDTYWKLRIEQTAQGFFEVCDICPVATPKTRYQIAFAGKLRDLNGLVDRKGNKEKTSDDRKKSVVIKNKSIVLTVRFPFDVDVVQESELKKIDKFVNSKWSDYENKVLLVKGYTDSVGDKKYNNDLATRRAINVRKVLVGLGADDVRVEANGKCCYLADNALKHGREINRRAEIQIYHKEGEL